MQASTIGIALAIAATAGLVVYFATRPKSTTSVNAPGVKTPPVVPKYDTPAIPTTPGGGGVAQPPPAPGYKQAVDWAQDQLGLTPDKAKNWALEQLGLGGSSGDKGALNDPTDAPNPGNIVPSEDVSAEGPAGYSLLGRRRPILARRIRR